jgi:hypothetical protein
MCGCSRRSKARGDVRLWQQPGFEIAGRSPRVFKHPSRGDVDALVMHQWLKS